MVTFDVDLDQSIPSKRSEHGVALHCLFGMSQNMTPHCDEGCAQDIEA